MADPTTARLCFPPPAAAIVVEPHTYPTADGPLPFDLYRPPTAAAPPPVVIIVGGYPDPGMTAMLGRPLKDWAATQDWARVLAAAGVAVVAYQNRTAADVTALVAHLRQAGAGLGLDPTRLGAWAASGNAPTALALVASGGLSAAALLYPMTLDVDGATEVATAARQFYFALPPLTVAELPTATPLLIVAAGADATPGLAPSLGRFITAARGAGLALTVLTLDGAAHGFDTQDDRPPTRTAIKAVVSFLARQLDAGG